MQFSSSLTVKWLSPSNTLGARFRVTGPDYPRKYLTVGYDYSLPTPAANIHAAAQEFLRKHYPDAVIGDVVYTTNKADIYTVPLAR